MTGSFDRLCLPCAVTQDALNIDCLKQLMEQNAGNCQMSHSVLHKALYNNCL